MTHINRLTVGFLLLGGLHGQGARIIGGAGWFQAGYAYVSGFDRLQNALQSQNLSIPTSSSGFTIGGGGGGYLGRIFIGGYGGGLRSAQINAGFGTFMVGPVWRLSENFLLLFTVGMGGGGYDLTAEDKGNAPQPAPAPTRSVRLSGGGWLAQSSLMGQYFFPGGFMMGLQVGYEIQRWTEESGTIQDHPTVMPQRFVVRLLIGGGSIIGKHDDRN
ncbi:MAG: hypothetical protein N2253_07750 [Bacteroidia bacterium]|nr:hypothetical protein [Bacteroidia bacterium]